MDTPHDIKQHVRLMSVADQEALLAWLFDCIDPQERVTVLREPVQRTRIDPRAF